MSRSGSTEPIVPNSVQEIPMEEREINEHPYKGGGGRGGGGGGYNAGSELKDGGTQHLGL